MRKHNLFGRTLAALLAVVMVLSCVPVSVFATETEEAPVPALEQMTEQLETPVTESQEAEEKAGEAQEKEAKPADDKSEEETTDGGGKEPVSIETVLAASEGTFTIKAVVALVNGQNYYVQDETGAMCVRVAASRNDIELGATIVATGSRTDYSGLSQLGSATVEISSGMTLTAKETTIAALTAADRCSYVKLTGLTVTKVEGTNLTLSDGTNTIQVYKAVIGDDVKAGAVVTVCAAVDMFNGNFQLRNTKASEIVVTTVAPDPEPTPEPDTPAAGNTWTKVTAGEQLKAGDKVVIVASGSDAALSTNQKSNNRGQATVSKSGDTVTVGEDTQILTLENGTKEGTWAFNTGSGYLYAASSSKNYLKTQTTLNDNGSWTVEIDEAGVATVKAQGDNTRNWLRYNSTSSLFSCYASGQENISLYQAGSGTPAKETVATPTGTESGDIEVGQTVSFACATEGATLLVKVNDGEYGAYTAPIAITQNTTVTVKATKEGMTDSAEVTFTYRAYEMKTQYQLADAPANGDEVVIYNAGNTAAVAGIMLGSYYLTPVTVEAKDGVIETEEKTLVWTVSESTQEDGSKTYTFRQGDSTLTMGTNSGKFNLNLTGDGATAWDLVLLNAVTHAYSMAGHGLTGTYGKDNPATGKVYLEYYLYTNKNNNTTTPEFSAYCTGESNVKEKAFGFQFYKAAQVKSYLDEQGTTQPEPEPEEPTTVPIAQALAGENGSTFTVKGVVTFTDGQNIYLQDATGGICLRLNARDTIVALGDTLIATGSKSVYNGLTQLSGTYEKSTGLELKAKEITAIADLTNADICTYVELKGVEVTEIYDGNGAYSSPNITVKDAAGTTIQLYKAVVTKKEDGSWPYAVGDKLDIKAAVGYFNKFQLRNTLDSEVTLAAATTDGIADGKYVIWVGGEYNMALSGNYGGYYNNGVAVTMDGSKLTGYSASEIWTVTNQEDGTITLSYDGKNLGMAKDYSSMSLGQMYDRWVLEDAGDGKWYVKNTVRGAYIQWYAENKYWSGFNYINEGTEAKFALTFTPAEEMVATDPTVRQAIAQWGGMLRGTETGAVSGDRYKVGDQKDSTAAYTAVVGGTVKTPYTAGGTEDAPLYYMGAAGLGSGTNDYMQLAVNTAGWADMTLAFRLRVSGGGPKSFQLCYSTDGGKTFQNFTTGSYDLSYTIYGSEGSTSYTKNGSVSNGVAEAGLGFQGNKANYVRFSFDVPKGASNCENLIIRLVPGTEKANGKTGLPGNTASTRLDNVVLTGSPIVSDGITGFVTVTPDGSEDQAVGTQLTMTSATEGAEILYRVNGGEWKAYSEESKPTLASLPCDVEAYAKSEGKQDSVIRLYHYSAGTVATVKMTPNGGSVWVPGAEAPVTVQLSTTTEGATIYYVVADESGTYPVDGEGNTAWSIFSEESPITLSKGFGTMKMKAYATKAGFTDSAVNEKTFTERETEEFNIYFGQLHSHTNISDGTGSITEAYAHGKSIETLDFLAVTDHSNSFDNTDNGDLNTDGTTVSSEWKEAKAAAKAISDNTFVGLYGYEMTWSNGLGHINTFNTAGWQSRTQTDYKTYATALENYYNKLETAPDSISQFNHPGTTFGDFQDFAYYSEARDQLITLIEVGNGEGEVGSSGYFPSYEYYTRALDKGWHVAPTNNQDNHKGRWGDANTARSVVLADNLTESAIYDAMRNYRVYATEDNDLNIYYTLDGNIMGSILSSSDVGESVEVNVLLADETDKLAGTKVQVIVNGGLVAASTTIEAKKSRTIDWQEEVTLSVPSSYNYYYIKVVQPDGDIAVTAPVWVGDLESVGISAFTTDAALPVKDQEMNLTLDLFNNVKKTLEIQSVVFQLGDGEDAQVIHTADLSKLGSVPAMGTASYTFSYTHNAVGKTQIYAVVTGTMNGQERIYKEKLELTFVPQEMVTRVIVDGTHYNDYVSGYYGGNINNLTTIAAESQIEVSVVTDEITADMLNACDLLIVSAPARKAGTANTGDYVAKPFEDSFLNLVKDYVDNGGTVIVCGLADYQDKGAASADYHAAAQLNKLLSTIGSTMRIHDDEVYDETNNGGQAYRLYPENFNMKSKWCQGIITRDSVAEGENYQTYSQYSGCTVDVGKGTWLVRGFDTTYSIDSDNDGVGGVAKGEAVMLAAEDTGKGGTIFAAGGVFVSDFEVKAELDNIWDLPYANRTIIENILGVIRTELPLSTIRQVRDGDMGEYFRTRGYVTAGTDNEYNKFFDAIYLQDDTAGITVFPFAVDGIALGTPMEIVGYVDEYQGDREIQITSYKILDEEPKVIDPEQMDNLQAMNYDRNGGKLIQVMGEVISVTYDTSGKGVSQFVLKDPNGDIASVFIDGYILSGTTGKNELASIVRMGNVVSAVGLLYMHPEGDSVESVPVIRVRNCDEVVAKSAGTEETDTYSVTVVKVVGGGEVSVDLDTAKKGDTVTITTKADAGYAVKSVLVNGGKVKVNKSPKTEAKARAAQDTVEYTFTMPAEDVEIEVTFGEYYTVTVKESKNGTITVSNVHPFAGEKVTITIQPKSGKQVNSVKVLDANGKKVEVTKKSGKWTFTMPESDVTVSATFKQASSRTGDTSHVYLYAGIMVVALLALVVLFLGRKKWFQK